jgi:hypothetical protein
VSETRLRGLRLIPVPVPALASDYQEETARVPPKPAQRRKAPESGAAAPRPRADSNHKPGASAAPLSSQGRPAVESQRRRKRQQLPPLLVHLTRPAASFASRLRVERGPIDRPTAERLARFMVAILTPRKPGGSQASDAVLTAVKMRQQGKKWPEIYPAAISGFANMPFDERSYRKFKLRRAASAYERRRRRKQSARRTAAASPVRFGDGAVSTTGGAEGTARCRFKCVRPNGPVRFLESKKKAQ